MPKRQLIDVFKQIDRNGPVSSHRPDLGPCWNWLGPYNERRRMPEFNCGGQKLIPYRVTWELINGQPWPQGSIALHACDNRRCCNPSHYSPGSVAQNNAEKEERERDNGMSHRDVRIVRFLISMAVSRKAIATLLEVSVSTIHAIASGQNHARTDSFQHTGTEQVSVRSDGETLNGESDTADSGGGGNMVPESDGDVGR